MPLSTYAELVEIDPGLGRFVPALGTNVVIVNTNSKALTGTAGKDPWQVMAGSGSGQGNVRPLRVPLRCAFLDLFHVFRAGNTAVSTSLKMRCAGLVPPGLKEARSNPGDIWPYNSDSNFTDVTEFYVPLTDSSGATEIDFGTSAGDLIYGVTGWAIQGPKSFYVAGTKLVIPMISQAMVGPTAGLVLARFSS